VTAGEQAGGAVVAVLLCFEEGEDDSVDFIFVSQNVWQGKTIAAGGFPEEISETERFWHAVDIKLGVVEGSMALVLRPFSFAKTIAKPASSPISDAVHDDAIGRTRVADIREVFPHFDGERLAAIRKLCKVPTCGR
jgi:hypothetical protein